jgi:hypothetical protein
MLVLIASYPLIATTSEARELKAPIHSHDQAIDYAISIMKNEGIDPEKVMITDIQYNYADSEWTIFYEYIKGALGSHFHIYINDHNPKIYRIGKGA